MLQECEMEWISIDLLTSKTLDLLHVFLATQLHLPAVLRVRVQMISGVILGSWKRRWLSCSWFIAQCW